MTVLVGGLTTAMPTWPWHPTRNDWTLARSTSLEDVPRWWFPEAAIILNFWQSFSPWSSSSWRRLMLPKTAPCCVLHWHSPVLLPGPHGAKRTCIFPSCWTLYMKDKEAHPMQVTPVMKSYHFTIYLQYVIHESKWIDTVWLIMDTIWYHIEII